MSTAFQTDAFQLDAVQVPAGVLGDVDYTLDIDPGSYQVSGAEVDLFYSRSQNDAGTNRKTYVIRNRRYKNLTREEAANLLAAEYIDALIEDVKVVERKRVIKVSQKVWSKIQPIDEDEEILLLL